MSFRRLLFIIILWSCVYAHAQNKQLLYDFTEIPQSLMINPGAGVDFKWYAGIPTLSGLSFQAGSSGISANDIFADDGLDINDKIRDRAIYGMSTRDELSGNYQVELLNIGFQGRDPDVFYSFGIYNEGDAIGYWPQDYAILAFEGNADKLNKKFDLSDLKTRGEVLNVFHFGINKKLRNNITVGARAKIYSGIIDFNSTRNKGHFVTTEGERNILANSIDADLKMRTSGFNAIRNANDEGTLSGAIIKRGFFGGDLGLGFDVGLTYALNKQTVFTASLLDVGFIYHANDIRTYTLEGAATNEGVEIILPDALMDPNKDYWQELVDEIETLVPFDINDKSYVTFRPTKLYTSLSYSWGKPLEPRIGENCDCDPTPSKGGGLKPKYLNSFGGQLYMINRPRGPQMALTAFYLRRFGNAMALKAAYTVDKFSKTNVGLGLNLQAGPINLYIMADNLLAYRNIAASRYASFQLGLNIISW